MKQVILNKGEVKVKDFPVPKIKDGEVLVKSAFSAVSTGTELRNKDSSGRSIIKRIFRNEDFLKKGIKFLREKGMEKAMDKASDIKDSEIPLGYSLSGEVIEVGKNVKEFQIGDRVACAGSGKATHSEFVAVPKNLVVKIPDGLDFESASSVTLGAIAMQSVRRSNVKIGERIAVVGLGLLGQILIQILNASGAKVIGFDVDEKKISLAKEMGFRDAYLASKSIEEVMRFTNDKGVDSTIITASSPKDDSISQKAMEMTRKKGKVVVVGNVGLGVKRSPFYEKEIDYLISTSYGPGRYDSQYEEKGIDYPFAYVRWTEKRNMKEYLELLRDGKVDFKNLINRKFLLEKAPEAYEFLENEEIVKPAVLLDYSIDKEKERNTKIKVGKTKIISKDKIKVGIIGAGGFARAAHIPNLADSSHYSISAICDLDRIICRKLSDKFKADYCTTDYTDVLSDKNIDAVIITLPHNLHARVAMEAIEEGKAVLCEKPMALNEEELSELVSIIKENELLYSVGFNRRYSPLIGEVKDIISERKAPLMINYQINPGYMSPKHWKQGKDGGGRNIGEACHIYDLFSYLIGDEIEKISATPIRTGKSKYLANDNFSATLRFKDGSIANLIYSSMGSNEKSKERMDLYFESKALYLDNYKELVIYDSKVNRLKLRKEDKGHSREIEEFAKHLKGEKKGFPIPLWQLVQATKISFEVEKQIFS